MESYLECLIMNKDKIDEIQDAFTEMGFKITHKSEDRIAFLKEDIYFEFYQDANDYRYFFRLINEDNEKTLYTYEYDKIDSKINQIISIIEKEV